MAAESSWSLRGVDPRAREIARAAAKREGITIGEWLNRQLLEDGEASADNDPAGAYDDPEALQHLLDRLSRRIEAAEHRSTLAITGIDQSVLGVISRLQSAEELQSELSQRYNTALNELRQTQTALQNRIAKLEREGGDLGGLEALKSLEEALAKLANQVYDSETDTRSRLDALRSDIERASKRSGDRIDTVSRALDERLADVERKVDTDLDGVTDTVAREVEAAARKLGRDFHAASAKVDQVDKDLQSVREDMDRARGDIEAMVADRAEAGREQIESLESAIGDVNARLGSAERVTDRAIKALEQSFSELDARMKSAEDRLDTLDEANGGEDLSEQLEARFSDLSRELADSVSTTRAELAAKMAEIARDQDASTLASRLEDMGQQIDDAERRQRGTLERISGEVAKLAGAVEARVRKGETALGERLESVQDAADAASKKSAASEAKTAKLSDEIADLQARISDAEAASAAAVDEVSRRVDAIGDAPAAGVSDEALAARIAESEQRTREMVDGALADMGRRVDSADEKAASHVSPVQSALEALRERLDTLEAGGSIAPLPSFEEPAPDVELIDDAETPAETPAEPFAESFADTFEEPAQAAPDDLRADDESFEIELDLGDDIEFEPSTDEAAAPETDDTIETTSDEAPAFDEPDFEAPDLESFSEETTTESFDVEFAEGGDETSEDGFDGGSFSFSDDELEGDGDEDDSFDLVFGGEERTGKSAKDKDDTDDFLRVARDAARDPGKAEADADPGFGPVANAPAGKSKKGRSLLAAAGGLAVLAVGAAGYIALRDAASTTGTGEQDANPLDDVFGGAEAPSGFATIEPGPISATASPFGEGAIPVDLDAATGPDFSLFAEGGALFAPIEPETPVDPAEMTALIDRAIAYAPDAPAAPPVAPEPETTTAAPAPTPAEEPATDVASLGEPAPAVEEPILPATPPASEAPAEEAAVTPAPSETEPEAATETAAPSPAPTPANAITLEAAAEAGDPIAQFEYGGALLDQGDLTQGVRLMRQAAENGLPAAQYRLAKLYETGRGVDLDLAEARRWTERAANAGHRRAMHNLGIFYAEGRGAPQDFNEAGRWFEEAALFGSTDSQFNLAVLYEQGLGVQLSPPDAYAWFSIAARAGDEGAADRATAVAERLTPQARERADEAVRRFSPRPLDEEVNGIFRNTPWSTAGVDQRTSIARAQAALSALGYEPGPADGVMGQVTRSAVQSYQASAGLEPTGDIDAALVEKLEADVAGL
ncbi:MAG: peptidoglycan-binding protein [Maricaulaceae bacterium]|jgi:localization factor PodJL